MMDARSLDGDRGRGHRGRFLQGNIFGKGNLFAREDMRGASADPEPTAGRERELPDRELLLGGR